MRVRGDPSPPPRIMKKSAFERRGRKSNKSDRQQCGGFSKTRVGHRETRIGGKGAEKISMEEKNVQRKTTFLRFAGPGHRKQNETIRGQNVRS